MDRFWGKVDKTDGCWRWKAATAGNGYGVFRLSSPRRQVYAHRHSYEMHYGFIPHGRVVMHTCDTPNCVRPDHLKLGTQADNVLDMDQKRRRVNANQQLALSAYPEIIRRIEAGERHKDIANGFNTTRDNVSRIAMRHRRGML